jgi:Uma2 family endonuclease
MSSTTPDTSLDWNRLIENIVTEDDEPVDNMPSATQQRLLVTPLYDSWTPPPNEDEPETKRKFLANANIGVFSSPEHPPLVPDMFLSLDVEAPMDWEKKIHRSYFIWHFEKAPDVVVEIVSNREGKELDEKLQRYARLDITYYVVYDPQRLLSDNVLRVFERGFGKRYRRRDDWNLPEIGLSLTLWEGTYEGSPNLWLRWRDQHGELIPTAAERASQAEMENARLRAELERLQKGPKPRG